MNITLKAGKIEDRATASLNLVLINPKDASKLKKSTSQHVTDSSVQYVKIGRYIYSTLYVDRQL